MGRYDFNGLGWLTPSFWLTQNQWVIEASGKPKLNRPGRHKTKKARRISPPSLVDKTTGKRMNQKSKTTLGLLPVGADVERFKKWEADRDIERQRWRLRYLEYHATRETQRAKELELVIHALKTHFSKARLRVIFGEHSVGDEIRERMLAFLGDN